MTRAPQDIGFVGVTKTYGWLFSVVDGYLPDRIDDAYASSREDVAVGGYSCGHRSTTYLRDRGGTVRRTTNEWSPRLRNHLARWSGAVQPGRPRFAA